MNWDPIVGTMTRRLTTEQIQEIVDGMAVHGVLQVTDYIHFARVIEDIVLGEYRIGEYAMESSDTISVRGNSGLGGKALKHFGVKE